MLSAVSRVNGRRMLTQIIHRRTVSQVWRYVTLSRDTAPGVNSASSRLSRTNSAVLRRSDVDISSKSCTVDAVWDVECCITSSCWFRSSSSLSC